MQKLFQRTKSVNPHILVVLIVLIAYAVMFMPLITVIYEEVSPNPSDTQKVAYVHDSINSVSECRWVDAQWETNLSQGVFKILSEFGFLLIWIPVTIVGFRYLQLYRPPILLFSIFIIILFLGPVLLYLLLRPDMTGPWNVCDYVPVIEVKNIYPSFLALFIWTINLILCVILYRKISIEEKVISSEKID